jgi:hypothetical protein
VSGTARTIWTRTATCRRSRPGNSQPAAIAAATPISMTPAATSPCSPAAVPSFAPSSSPMMDIMALAIPNMSTATAIGTATAPSASPTAKSSRLSAAPLTSSRHPCQACACGASSPPRSASTSPQTAATASIPAPAQRAAGPSSPATPRPMSIPAAGITTSHKPKTVATLSSVRRLTPLTPMAIDAPKLFSPRATATTSSATMRLYTSFARDENSSRMAIGQKITSSWRLPRHAIVRSSLRSSGSRHISHVKNAVINEIFITTSRSWSQSR